MRPVPIPAWTADGVLPPIDASQPVSPERSPYLVSLTDYVLPPAPRGGAPEEDVLDRSSLLARLRVIEEWIARAAAEASEPARVILTFRGRPVIGSHGVFVEFGTKAIHNFADAVVAMAASATGPLAATGPIPNRDQHQLLITSTAVGSFGFQLEERMQYILYRASEGSIRSDEL